MARSVALSLRDLAKHGVVPAKSGGLLSGTRPSELRHEVIFTCPSDEFKREFHPLEEADMTRERHPQSMETPLVRRPSGQGAPVRRADKRQGAGTPHFSFCKRVI